MVKAHPSNIARGKNKGHLVTKLKKSEKEIPANRRKGRLGKRPKVIQQIVGSVAGFTNYEKRMVEFLKTGIAKDSKRAYKVAKKALGTHLRAKNKREKIVNFLRDQQQKKKA